MSIVITTQSELHNEWMTFACWYSINQILPKWKVAVVFKRSNKYYQFELLNRCNVPYLAYPIDKDENYAINNLIKDEILTTPLIIIKDNHMVIRNIEDSFDGIINIENLPCFTSASSNETISVVDYQTCGKFNLDNWRKKEKTHPFHNNFLTKNRTINEQRIFQLWRKMATTYEFLKKN